MTIDEHKITEAAGTRLWPSNEPSDPDATCVLGDYRNPPDDFVIKNGVLMAVCYNNTFTSYSGAGTGPISCRLYRAETLINHGGHWPERSG